MRFILFFSTTFLFSLSISAQGSYADFVNEDDFHKKTEISYDLLYKYERNDFDSLLFLSKQLLLIGKENNLPYSVAMAEFGFGSYYSIKGKNNKAIKSFQSALIYFKAKEDYQLVSEILNGIGNSYAISNEFSNAIESYISSMDFGSISRDETAAFNAEIGLAKAYYSMGDSLKGDMMMKRYIKSCTKYEKYQSISNAYSYLAMVEQDRGNQVESMICFDKSIYYGLESDSKIQLSHIYTNKAIVFFNIENYDSSLVFFQKALELRKEVRRPRQVCESYFNLASFYIERGDLDKALIEVEASISISKKNHLIQDEYDGIELLKFIYDEKGDSVQSKKQDDLLEILQAQKEEKSELSLDVVDYMDDLGSTESSLSQSEPKSKEGKMWILIAGAIIIILAGGTIGRSYLKSNERD